MKRGIILPVLFAAGMITAGAVAGAQEPPEERIPVFNTVKAKLGAGRQVVGGTVATSDPEIYCAMAEAGFDFLWIEMQHSPLTYSEVARMIWACRGSPAIPFIRVPDATEGDIQKAADIGALGIIIPMVDNVEKVRNAVTFARYPPAGKRSQGDADYEALVTRIKDATLRAGRKLGGPVAWMGERDGYTFFPGPGATSLIRTGAGIVLAGRPTPCGQPGVAPIEGEEPCP